MNDAILSTKAWYHELSELIRCSRDKRFLHLLSRTCERISYYDSTLITAYPRQSRPVHLYNNTPPEQISRTLTPYFAGAYLLDPFYALCQNHARVASTI